MLTTCTVPPFSAVMYAFELSGRNADERGRAPTSSILMTLLLAVSMTATWLSSSDVTYTHCPFGLVVTPSGSPPTLTSPMILLLATSMMLATPASSFDTNTFDPSALNEICSGSVPLVSTVVTFPRRDVDDADAVRGSVGRRKLALVGARGRHRRSAQRNEQLGAVGAHLDAARPLAERNRRHHLIRAAVDHRQVAADLVGDVHVVRRLRRLRRRRRRRRRRGLLRRFDFRHRTPRSLPEGSAKPA